MSERKFNVGDRVRIIGGRNYDRQLGTVVAYEGGCDPYWIQPDNGPKIWCNEEGRPNINLWERVELLTESKAFTHLPAKFKLNPNGNEALSRAMQERLFELGCQWHALGGRSRTQPTYEDYGWLIVNDGEIVGNKSDYYTGHILLTLDDLYKLTPKQELPKLEIAGRTLELENGRIIGSEFNCDPKEFIEELSAYLTPQKFGNQTIRAASVRVGCQLITAQELQTALNWAKEINQ